MTGARDHSLRGVCCVHHAKRVLVLVLSNCHEYNFRYA